MSDVRDVLMEARALIEKGWTRTVGYRDGRYCIVGALSHVTDTDYPNYQEAAKLLEQAIDTKCLASWNDEQTTKKPVLAALDRAIEMAS